MIVARSTKRFCCTSCRGAAHRERIHERHRLQPQGKRPAVRKMAEREAVALYHVGHSLNEVAKRAGVNATTVLHCLRKAGVQPRPRGAPKSMDPSRTEAMKQRLLRGDSTGPVAADYGLTRARISQIAQAHGFPLQQLRRNKTADVVRETAALAKAGHDLKEVGARVGIRPDTVRKYLNMAGVKAKPKYVRTFDPAKVEELRERLYCGEPIGSIVTRFGVAKDTISRLARYYGFPRQVRRRNDPVYKEAVRQQLAHGEKITAVAAHFRVTPSAIRKFIRRHGLDA